jgi:cell division protein FtsI/penicillin-binding protein 2
MAGRTRVVFYLVAAWFAVIVLRMGYLASGVSQKHRIASETVSGMTYPLPALRGTIYDSNNTKLVWSEKHYDLVAVGSITVDEAEELRHILKERDIKEFPEHDTIAVSLSADELMALEKMLKTTPSLHVKSRIERVVVNDNAVREMAGSVDKETGRGVSGWEKEYDTILQGANGSFYVKRDRKGRWIPGTGNIKTMPIPGRDVHVPYSLNAQGAK